MTNAVKLEEDVMKLFALDIFMRQVDRGSVNILLEESFGEINLAPVYDYSASFLGMAKHYCLYENSFLNINF